MDFGIAIQATAAQRLEGSAAGTLEYMAPELLLGQPPSVVADLYSVGVLAFELLTGQFPFEHKNRTSLLSEVLGTRADVTLPDHIAALFPGSSKDQKIEDADAASDGEAEAGSEGEAASEQARKPRNKRARDSRFEAPLATLTPDVQAILRRLLARDPKERFQDAASLLAALNDALRKTAEGPLPLETAEIRDSFLSASRLVGRDAEIARFTAVLDRKVQSQSAGEAGSVILLGGESGVGKSRLLDEVRALSLVRGMLVLRGHGVAATGGVCHVFLDVLRHLCLYSTLDDLEAGVLKKLLPELPAILGRAIPEAPELEAQAAQSRLLFVAARLLERQTSPTVILLDDLQWADADSLALLRRLAESVAQRPFVIIATYRSDEVPDLPATLQLKNCEVFPCKRLDREGIAELAQAMTGEAGTEKLVALLEREAAGNPHFIVEIIRLLAESSGRLDAIEFDEEELPQKLLGGGIREILRRRLSSVPGAVQPLLQLAAVGGRKLDTRVLAAAGFAQGPGQGQDLERLLFACASVAVLEVSDGNWRFAHDRLRERLLADLDSAERRALHAKYAQALEKISSHEPVYSAALAYHFRQAGKLAKSAYYAALAGELSLRTGGLSEAVALLTSARELQSQFAAPPLLRARVLRLLASALWGLGRLGECLPIMEEALSLLGVTLPASPLSLGAGVSAQTARQLVHRLLPGTIVAPKDLEARNRLKELLEIILGSGEMYAWVGEQGKILYTAILCVNLAEQLGESASLVMLYAVMGFLGEIMGISSMRAHYLALAETQLLRIGPQKVKRPGAALEHAKAAAELGRIVGALHLMKGEWMAARLHYDKAVAHAQSIGNGPLYLFSLVQRATVGYWEGDYATAETDTHEALTAARRNGFGQYQVWALSTFGAIMLRRGNLPAAQQFLEDAYAEARREHDVMSRIFTTGLRAVLMLRLSELELAAQLADEAWRDIKSISMTGHGAVEGYLGMLETYLELAEQVEGSERHALLKKVDAALPKMQRYARMVPIAGARTTLFKGQLAWLRGDLGAALRFFRHGLRTAERLALPYDEALSHAWLGRLGRTGDAETQLLPDPELHFDAARRLGARISAVLPPVLAALVG